jgi:hypothetical protein
MARLTESGAFTGANASAPRSRASLPGVVGPDEGNESAKLNGVVAARSAAPKINFRMEIFTKFSISVCYAERVSQKIAETYSTSFAQGTGAQPCSRIPVDAMPTSRKLGDINFSAAGAQSLFPRHG